MKNVLVSKIVKRELQLWFEKFNLLHIGKLKNQGCFKGINSLDVDYEYNKKT